MHRMCLLPLIAWALLPVPEARSEPAAAKTPIYTRSTRFAIPFTVATSQDRQQAPVQVQLHLSEDRGLMWRPYAHVEPGPSTSFSFQAPRDGEYWFMIRTKDRGGRLLPLGPAEPEMKVVVDSAPPAVELNAQWGDAGQILCTWRIDEAHLAAETLKIEYQPAGTNDPWLPVAIDPVAPDATGQVYNGQVTLPPPRVPGVVLIRATVADKAGNSITRGAPVSGAPKVEEIAAGETPAPAGETIAPGARSVTNWPAEEALGSHAPGTAALAVNTAANAEAVPPGVPSAPPPNVAQDEIIATPPQYATTEPGATSAIVTPSLVSAPLSVTSVAPAVDSVEITTAAKPVIPGLPADAVPRMVNSKTFELDYTIESAGVWGLSKVELWGTRDGGQTWKSYTVDADNRSPMTATVDEEGLYGFRIEVQRSGDTVGPAPQSGQPAEVWVLVDMTPPTVTLERIEQGTGLQAEELAVTWQASDASLAARPISLAYAVSPAGPWNTIAADLENTGKHTWRISEQTPERFYFRLTARDLAGNVGTFETSQALRVEISRPRGRIQDVRPLGAAGGSRVINNPY